MSPLRSLGMCVCVCVCVCVCLKLTKCDTMARKISGKKFEEEIEEEE